MRSASSTGRRSAITAPADLRAADRRQPVRVRRPRRPVSLGQHRGSGVRAGRPGVRSPARRSARPVPRDPRRPRHASLGRAARHRARLARHRELQPEDRRRVRGRIRGRRALDDEPRRSHPRRPRPGPRYRADRAAVDEPSVAAVGARAAPVRGANLGILGMQFADLEERITGRPSGPPPELRSPQLARVTGRGVCRIHEGPLGKRPLPRTPTGASPSSGRARPRRPGRRGSTPRPTPCRGPTPAARPCTAAPGGIRRVRARRPSGRGRGHAARADGRAGGSTARAADARGGRTRRPPALGDFAPDQLIDGLPAPPPSTPSPPRHRARPRRSRPERGLQHRRRG